MNNVQIRLFIKNVFYVVGANLSRIITTFILTMFLPKLLSMEDYGYWQLYAFYSSYLNFSSLGWGDGILLKYGGEDYRRLDGRELSGQFFSLAVYETLFAAIVLLAGDRLISDPKKLLALKLAMAFTGIQILKYQLQMILQATHRIREYARNYTGERMLYFFLVILCLALGRRDFRYFACMEILSAAVMLLYAVWLCREVTFQRPAPLRRSLSLARELIRTGSKLCLAGLAAQLIVGIVRFAMEEHWGIDTFGRISLSLSMANMLITCISAVGVVLYPMLRRTRREVLSELYLPVRSCLTAAMYGFLLCYVPARRLLELWLPQYRESLRYLAILFPLCIYETRTSVLTLTYLKTLRREKDIMKVNICTVLISAALTFCTVHIWGNLDLAVLSIILLYAVKAVLTESLLARQMPLPVLRDHLLEGGLTAAFIFSSWSLPGCAAFAVYFAAYLLFLGIGRKKLLRSVAELREIIKK